MQTYTPFVLFGLKDNVCMLWHGKENNEKLRIINFTYLFNCEVFYIIEHYIIWYIYIYV